MSKTVGVILEEVHQAFDSADLFYGHGSDNPWDEAVFLVCHVVGYPMDVGSEVLRDCLTEAQEARIQDLVKKRVSQRIPLPYLMQRAWFAGLEFYVDERVLIPRSPLAEWILNRFEPFLRSEETPPDWLELGTGSGCIAIACAEQLRDVVIDAVDVSREALEVAAINLRKHRKDHQIRLIHSDLFNSLSPKRYDWIIANPPYVDEAEMRALPEEYRREPEMALAAGRDGLSIARRIVREAPQWLKKGAHLIIEVGFSEEAAREHFADLPLVWLSFQNGGSGVFCVKWDGECWVAP